MGRDSLSDLLEGVKYRETDSDKGMLKLQVQQ